MIVLYSGNMARHAEILLPISFVGKYKFKKNIPIILCVMNATEVIVIFVWIFAVTD